MGGGSSTFRKIRIVQNEGEAFTETVNKFLSFNEYKVLDGKGKISKEQADKKALAEYEVFNKTQPIESDFDREVKKFLKNSEK